MKTPASWREISCTVYRKALNGGVYSYILKQNRLEQDLYN